NPPAITIVQQLEVIQAAHQRLPVGDAQADLEAAHHRSQQSVLLDLRHQRDLVEAGGGVGGLGLGDQLLAVHAHDAAADPRIHGDGHAGTVEEQVAVPVPVAPGAGVTGDRVVQ